MKTRLQTANKIYFSCSSTDSVYLFVCFVVFLEVYQRIFNLQTRNFILYPYAKMKTMAQYIPE